MEENQPIVNNVTDNANQLVHGFGGPKSFLTPQLLVVFIIVILLGIGGGYFLSKAANNGPVAATTAGGTNSSTITAGATFGSDDTKTFKDVAEGTLKEGGIEDEGQFHLERPGGDSQNVYMTSSIVDLSKFVDKKVKVWGQTQQAQHAGWLMDVGRVQVE